jgi:hypothetical protein
VRTTRLLLLVALVAGAGAALPAQSYPAATCLVISDSQGDSSEISSPTEAKAAESYGDSADPASDIRWVRLGTSGDRFVAEIRVTDVGLRRPGSPGLHWEITWLDAAGQTTALWAERPSQGRTDFQWNHNGDSGSATGVIDTWGRDVVRIEASAALLGIADGDRITDIQATTTELTGPAPHPRDTAPDKTDYGVAYVAGVACAQQDASACPVVLDSARDAGTLVHRPTDVPSSPQAVDLLAAGASSDAETVLLSVRVVRPTAEPPAGYSTVGWTVSWWDGTQRWYAQAARSKTRTRFSYGIDSSDDNVATGPVPGGLETTGRIAGRVIEIAVPRAVLGGPADGTLWTRFAATAWALSDTDVDQLGAGDANPFRVFDETPAGRWRLGVNCGA